SSDLVENRLINLSGQVSIDVDEHRQQQHDDEEYPKQKSSCVTPVRQTVWHGWHLRLDFVVVLQLFFQCRIQIEGVTLNLLIPYRGLCRRLVLLHFTYIGRVHGI